MAAELASSRFLILRTFGSCGEQQLEVTGLEGSPDSEGRIAVPFRTTAVLQRASASLQLLNKSHVCCALQWESDSPVFTAEGPELVLPPLHQYLAAIRSALDLKAPKGKQTEQTASSPAPLTLRFAPRSPGDWTSTIRARPVTHAQSPDQEPVQQDIKPVFLVSGRSELPVVHIDVPSSRYVISGERSAELPTPAEFRRFLAGPAATRVRVVDISGRGIKIRSAGNLSITNPLSASYRLRLRRLKPSSARIVADWTEGRLGPGDTTRLTFRYTPEAASLKQPCEEAFFLMEIPEHDVTVPLLVLGRATEPLISLSSTKLVFKPTLVGRRDSRTIVINNQEGIPFAFRVRTAGLDSRTVLITPTEGVVPGHSRTELTITVEPHSAGKVNKNVVIDFPKKATPLHFNLKYEGFTLKHTINLQPISEGQRPIPLSRKGHQALDFGKVFVMDRRERRIHLANDGTHPLSWNGDLLLQRALRNARRDELELKAMRSFFTFTPSRGALDPGESLDIVVSFEPRSELNVDTGFGLQLNIALENGPTYAIRLHGRAVRPLLSPSWEEHDFGSCLVNLPVEAAPLVKLQLRNNDMSALAVDCDHVTDGLELLDAPSGLLAPGQSRSVSIRFRPTEVKLYRESICLIVNGLFRMRFRVRGEGVPLKLRCPVSRLNLGAVTMTLSQSSKSMVKKVPITNRSKAEVNIKLHAPGIATVPGLFIGAFPPNDPTVLPSAHAALEKYSQVRQLESVDWLQALPKTMRLDPGATADVLVMFRPISRLEPFQEPVSALVSEATMRPLFSVSGAALGLAARVDGAQAVFPPCVINAAVTREFVISNTGDVAMQWAMRAPRAQRGLLDSGVFSLSNAKGTLPPGSSSTVMVTFRPPKAGRYELRELPLCLEEGAQFGTLSLLGTGVSNPDDEKVKDMAFETQVRGEQAVEVHIPNPEDSEFTVLPSLSGPHATMFKVPARIVVPSGGREIAVLYRPRLMSSEAEPHKAELFLPLRNGSALLLKLTGVAKPPLPSTNLSVSGPARSSLVIPVPLTNWEDRTQRFSVTCTMNGDMPPSLYRVRLPRVADVPGQGSRTVEVRFESHVEGEFTGELRFTSEETGEYVPFTFTATVLPADIAEHISLEAGCREAVSRTVRVHNPFPDHTLNLTVNCGHEDITPSASSLLVQPMTDSRLTLRYLPLVVKQATATLTLSGEAEGPDGNQQVSPIIYELTLRPLSPKPSPLVRFSAPLAKSITNTLRMQSYAQKDATFQVGLSEPITSSRQGAAVSQSLGPFSVSQSSLTLKASPDGQPTWLEIQVTFDPDSVGQSAATLFARSDVAGEFRVPLSGSCLPPQPQGPVLVPPGGKVPIHFRNPLRSPLSVVYSVDHPGFTLSSASESIGAHGECKLTVSFKGAAKASGRLVISTDDDLEWVYYLSGSAGAATAKTR
eukprot:gnl/Dysnectes_brevis/3364_a4233_301.p1 GENE.gnl/Dysnectes_brevis/3364_a4233_301~~gnl/Dysnectes_brevis/3364_a4233_301.p1  ORF type:complete len:1450 (+),score=663.85 gnl/Dysnectes_brevis/3364_a4233_301:69-4352(+)